MEVQGRKAAAAICTIGLQLQLNVSIYNSQWYDRNQDINLFESRLKFYRTKVSTSEIIL